MFVVLILPALVSAEETKPEKILIRNVRMIDRKGKAKDETVNILIKKTKLNVITQDEIALEDGMVGYDAQNGVVLGNLEIGKPANFMIVDRDPSEDFDVLLDTKTHLVFAIRDGEIVRNTLDDAGAPDPEKEEKKSGWIAYEPPPMALPSAYLDRTKWNRWDTKYFSGIFLSAVALDRHRWLSQDADSEDQVGDLDDYDGGEIRAFRLGIAGSLNFQTPLIYSFVIATHAFDKGFNTGTSGDVTFLDYRLDIRLSRQLAISIGKQKEPISMERLLLGTQLQMQERPVAVDAMFPVRNIGFTVNGASFGRRVAWAVGVFNDWFDASQRLDESATQVVGRATGLAWISEDDSHLVHLGFGIRYTDAREGVRYRTSPEFNQSPIFVDTDLLDAEKAVTYDFEVAWRRGPFWFASEFIRSNVDADQLGDPSFKGFHVSGSWIITREMRKYHRRNGTFGPAPVSKSVYQGGLGTWEVAGRYSSLDLSNGSVDGGDIDVLSLGLNWWLTATFGANLNYRHVILHRYGLKGQSDGIMGRVILMLE
jgi:phosphate-selective porin OprO/OprP